MNENNKRIIIFGILGLIWVVSVFTIIAPKLGLATTVFPRPQPDYELYTMLVSGVLLVVYSLKTAVQYFKLAS
jgi:hypothetical protein